MILIRLFTILISMCSMFIGATPKQDDTDKWTKDTEYVIQEDPSPMERPFMKIPLVPPYDGNPSQGVPGTDSSLESDDNDSYVYWFEKIPNADEDYSAILVPLE